MAAPIKIYTDTNVLRYFGMAFATREIPADLKDQLLLSPLSVMELLSQLGTKDAAEAFAAIQAFPRVHNPAASGMLPWSDEFFRLALFKLPVSPDTITPALNSAIVNAMNAQAPEDLKVDGEEMRAALDKGKLESAAQFADVRNDWRKEGELQEGQHRAIFARSIAHRAGVDEATVDVDFVVNSLDALYCFEKTKIQVGAKSNNYNVVKHANDVYDAELLIYLADPGLHLLTSDGGFRRTEKSSQWNRVHIVEADCLRDPDCAISVIRGIVEG